MKRFFKVTNHEKGTFTLIPDSQALTLRAYRCKPVAAAAKIYKYADKTFTYVGAAAFWRMENDRVEAMKSASEFDEAFVEWLETHMVDVLNAYDEEGNPITEDAELNREELDPLH